MFTGIVQKTACFVHHKSLSAASHMASDRPYGIKARAEESLTTLDNPPLPT
jgi:hypothetical protein